ncbi:MAG: hypothetical protein HXY34_06815 [Candidatus Thorarchaeota archaeon]|nr:hypothetical protein [Candidatus Thorarchaeota archaeon]
MGERLSCSSLTARSDRYEGFDPEEAIAIPVVERKEAPASDIIQEQVAARTPSP